MTPQGLPPNVRVLSELETDHSGFSVADESIMRALSRAEDHHFWHRARNRFIAHRLRRLGLPPPGRILELGCGGGCVAAYLERRGWSVTGVDGHLARVRQAAARAPGATFLVHDLRQGLEPLGETRHEGVALFDVLEHLEHPETILRQALGLVAPGGFLVGTVPSLMSLWSAVDVRSGHRLRFERRGLTALLAALPGAEAVETAYFNRLLVPLLWLQRKARPRPDALERGLEVPWAPLNASLAAALWLEQQAAPLLERLPVPGASLWFAVRVQGGRPA